MTDYLKLADRLEQANLHGFVLEDYADCLREAAALLRTLAQPAAVPDGWIPVRERLPPDHRRVLASVTFPSGSQHVCLAYYHCTEDDTARVWQDDDDMVMGEPYMPTHWQPLPAPPTGTDAT